ncbi:hypothetical protein GF312_19030 [Candidatus Poribacteria bacterium]|nr:hypothetical protein [Candidatus Poribacteria bacterium]
MIKTLKITAFILLALMFVLGCGNDEDEEEADLPSTGSISGTITFVDEPPEAEVKVQVSIFSMVDPTTNMPMGPPAHYSDPLTQHTGNVPYQISGVSFGEYKLAAVGYAVVGEGSGMPNNIIGMYGFSPPVDMEPDSFSVTEEQPDITGIDIIATYASEEQNQHPQ